MLGVEIVGQRERRADLEDRVIDGGRLHRNDDRRLANQPSQPRAGGANVPQSSRGAT
jgi:hypothetical protein